VTVYAIIGEDPSDFMTLKAIVRTLAGESVSIKGIGYEGCGELMRKGAKALGSYKQMGFHRFIVCRDSDGPVPDSVYDDVLSKIVRPADVEPDAAIVIPVEEIEAWILADLGSVRAVIPSFDVREISNPERIRDPKEYLQRLSEKNGKARYRPSSHNERVAPHLNLSRVFSRCESFRELWRFVKGQKADPA
jgi:Domain of unknown function (DUF4276)